MNRSAHTPLRELDVLVVDDHPVNREVVACALADRVRHVAQAACALEAIELAGTRHFDLVLLDLHLPDQSGLLLAERLRQIHGDRPLWLVALTGDTHAGQAVRDAGFAGLLPKPVDPRELAGLLERVVAGSEDFVLNRRAGGRQQRLIDEAAAVRACGSPEQARRMQAALAEDLLQRWPELETHLQAGRVDAAQAWLHRMQGACAYAGATRLIRSLERIQALLEAPQRDALADTLAHAMRVMLATASLMASTARMRTAERPQSG